MPTLTYKSKSRTVKIHWTLDDDDDAQKLFAIHLSDLLEAIGIEALSYLLAQTLAFTVPDEDLCVNGGWQAKEAETSLFEAAEAFVSASDDLQLELVKNLRETT